MSSVLKVWNSSDSTVREGSFLKRFCIPFLVEMQNADGGWGYQRGTRSAVEPTAWALLALKSQNVSEAALDGGMRWLHRAQLPEGSWPAFAGQGHGCWVTAPACLALSLCGDSSECVAQGLRWLCDSWPAEGGIWWQLRRLVSPSSVVRQDFSLRGWSWTPGTASWVEPTAHALFALRSVPEQILPYGASRRCLLGERMLCDRMCQKGGWNSGNPMVYGVEGEPRVAPTAWALLALHGRCDHKHIRKSLDWLELAYPHVRGPASLALGHLTLEAYGRPAPPLEPGLWDLWRNNQFFDSVLATAWAVIALSPGRDWLRIVAGKRVSG